MLAFVVVSINLFFVGSTINAALPSHWAIYTAFGILGFLYLLMVAYLCLHLIEAFGGHCLSHRPVSNTEASHCL